jgi:magnesium transporter
MSTAKESATAGLPPGTLIHVGDLKSDTTSISIIDYDGKSYQEKDDAGIEDVAAALQSPTVTWVNVTGLTETAIIEQLGGLCSIHPLVLEDILNTRQRPKMEDFFNYLYLVVKMLSVDEGGTVYAEQVSFIITKTAVISFQEQPGDVFNSVRNRIKTHKGRIRTMGADYLAYALLDAVVDNYFIVFERIGEMIEVIEDELIIQPTPDILQTIYSIKRDLIYIRKAVFPLREVMLVLDRGDSSLITEPTQLFFRDVYDHVIQVTDTIETYRDMTAGMLDIYLSSVSNRMNEVMKVLTIIATIFIPLTFIAGVYGMNFAYMPELGSRLGYPGALFSMAIIALVMIIFFRRKGWL